MSEALPEDPFYEGVVGPIPVAHGCNTIEDVQAASDQGFSYVEMDSLGTIDGVAVAYHRPTLPWHRDGIDRLTFSEIKDMAATKGRPDCSQEEIMGAFPGMRFFINLKNVSAVRPVARIISQLSAHNRVCITSDFDYGRVRAVRELVNHNEPICSSMAAAGGLALAATRAKFPHAEDYIRNSGATQFTFPFQPVLPTTTERAHRLGMRVFVWTPNTEPQIIAAIAKGVDGIMSDRTTLLRELTDRTKHEAAL